MDDTHTLSRTASVCCVVMPHLRSHRRRKPTWKMQVAHQMVPCIMNLLFGANVGDVAEAVRTKGTAGCTNSYCRFQVPLR